jgi:hypothetical protein
MGVSGTFANAKLVFRSVAVYYLYRGRGRLKP